jgi:predicted RNA-binding protein with TRAM domain
VNDVTDERRDKSGVPKPVSVGDVVEITVESVGRQGDGIAKVDGFVVFVKGAKNGENCRVRITDVRRTCALAEKDGAAAAESPKEMNDEEDANGESDASEEEEE